MKIIGFLKLTTIGDQVRELLRSVRHWLDALEVREPGLLDYCASSSQLSPFERDIKLFGRKVFHMPPLCKLNPLYEQLAGLRFRSMLLWKELQIGRVLCNCEMGECFKSVFAPKLIAQTHSD